MQVARPVQPAVRSVQRKPQVLVWVAVLFAAVVGLVFVFPYLWMLSAALKSTADFHLHRYNPLPTQFTAIAFQQAWTVGRMARYTFNSFQYATATTVAHLIFDSAAAYAFARLQFRGRDALFMILLGSIMLPGSVTLIPNYLIVHSLGLSNQFLGVVLPHFAGAFGIFLLRQFFLNIPRELEDAAVIDGANRFQIYTRIILPNAKPALITLAIFVFMGTWNDFTWPLVVLTDALKYPVTVGIALFRDESNFLWNNIFAASVIASTPLIALFFVLQRYIVGGLSLSGLKD